LQEFFVRNRQPPQHVILLHLHFNFEVLSDINLGSVAMFIDFMDVCTKPLEMWGGGGVERTLQPLFPARTSPPCKMMNAHHRASLIETPV
jgi:hypothetical protein